MAISRTQNLNLRAQEPNLKEDPHHLFETLFRDLHTSFQNLFSALPRFPDDEAQIGSDPVDPNPRLWPVVEDAAMALRQCLVSLTTPHTSQKLLPDKMRLILSALKAFVSVDVRERCGRTVVRLRNFVSSADVELSDSCFPFLCAVLEVFADELLRHQSLRRYLLITDLASTICEKLCVCKLEHDDDITSVLDVISTHFILSVSNEKAFENFIGRLFLHCGKDSRSRELSLAPAISLLMEPAILSVPKMFQAHIISLVSDAFGSGLSSKNLAPNINWPLTAFQKSVILYSIHFSSLQIDGFSSELNCGYNLYQHQRRQPTFKSSILQVKDNSWDSYQSKVSSNAKPNLLADCVAFMKGNQYIFAGSCRDMAVSILEGIIHQTFSHDASGDVLYTKKNTTTADICLLASILKLMGVSLIQAIKCLTNSGGSGCLKTMESTSVHEKYDLLISHVHHFQQIKFVLPVQTFLYDVMKSRQTNYNISKSMLVHFSGLLSLSFSSGLDLLAKGCTYVIMAVMCLYIFEEGDLVALNALRGVSLESCSSIIQFDKTGEVGDNHKQSIYKAAAQYVRIRRRCFRSRAVISCDVVEDEKRETCSGEAFLDCILVNPKAVSDYAELADFIECSAGKDYSSWLKGRERHRIWRYNKMINSRKIKKKKIWKSFKGQGNFKSSKHRVSG